MKLSSKNIKISGLSMITLVIGMILATPVLACTPNANFSQMSINCPTCGGTPNQTMTIGKLDSNKINNYLSVVSIDTRVEKLTKELTSRGYELNIQDTTGSTVTLANGSHLEAMALPFKSKDNSIVSIAVIMKDNKITTVYSAIIHRDQDLFPTSSDVLTINGNSVENQSVTTNSIFGEGFKAKIISMAATNSVMPMSINWCTSCQQAYSLLQSLGCSYNTAYICAVLFEEGGLPGAACLTMLGIECWIIGTYGTGQTAYAVCQLAGYC